MNRRQKKKKFKKQWGANPEEVTVLLQEAMKQLPDMIKEITESCTRMINETMIQFRAVMKEAGEDLKNISDALERYAEMVKFEEILKNAIIIDSEDDINEHLLEDLGWKQDCQWNTYHLYRDNANEIYYVRFKEGANE